ncbi:uncharacterized protein BDV17DRAFT_233340 [Aspergillus undulatus]|uniref:uncharacterized protein n=1 Tax=Aspergillus undulatus TaxID=1810928 RepID=UPI003CCCAAF6
MLGPFLSLTALCLSILTVSADDAALYSRLARSAPGQPYTLNLPVAECAFSYTECIDELPSLSSLLRVTISTKNDTLLANDEIIFPASMPMEFHAQRSWSSGSESVPVAYALDVQPLPHQPDGELGGLYRLTLTLVDLQGRPATESPVAIGMVRDTEGNFEIIQVEESSRRRFHHHLAPASEAKKDRSWWATKKAKSLYVDLLHKTSYSWHYGSGSKLAHVKGNEVDVHVDCGHDDGHGHHHHHQSPTDWGRNRHYLKHLRPVLLPGLMGLLAGVLSCVLGFLVGKVIVSIYSCLCNRAGFDDDYERVVAGIGFSAHDEKIRLTERDAYAHSQ